MWGHPANGYDTYKYYVKQGNRILTPGITNSIAFRAHDEFDKSQQTGIKTRIVQVGRRTTRTAAERWMMQEDARLFGVAPSEHRGVREETRRAFAAKVAEHMTAGNGKARRRAA